MTQVGLWVVGGLDLALSGRRTTIDFPDGAAVGDIPDRLLEVGIDAHSPKYLVVLNGLGWRQFPPEQKLKDGDVLLVIPPLMGG
ncbi:MAG: MoaD/ThiS family protein [Anaerolineae bacterium]|nr:MoaD/ThiS family protein [Anaerolineae bacterium]